MDLKHTYGEGTPHDECPIIPAALEFHAGQTHPCQVFIQPSGEDRIYSWADVLAEARRRGAHLLAKGFKKGDRVAFIMPEGEDFVLFFLGALSAGVVPVPMYPPLGFGKLDAYIEASARIMRVAGARAVLTNKQVEPVLWSLVDKVDCLEQLITAESMTGPAPGPDPDISLIRREDPAFIQFTSGSTSDPKGVVVTHGSLVANLYGIMVHALEVEHGDIACSWLPLYHDMGLIGMVLAPIWYGITGVFLPTLTFVKHPKRWMEMLSQYNGSITFAPNFAYALATRRTSAEAVEKLDLSRLKVLGCGAEPNHPGTLRDFMSHFAPAGLKGAALMPCYGMAEATLAISFVGLRDSLRTDVIDGDTYHDKAHAIPINGKPAATKLEFVSCGHVLPGHAVTIIDEDGNPLPARTVGEVVFSGPSVAAGYFENPEASAATFTPQGLRTGDLGYVVRGELFVTGRRKDIVILNGKNYDPQSIEWAAAEVDGVRKGNVVAFSRPTPSSEELIVVAETKTDEPNGLAEAIRRRVREELFLNVAEVRLVPKGTLPKTTSGKLQRNLTKRQFLEGTLGQAGVRTMGYRGAKLVLARHLARSFVSRVRHEGRRRAVALVQRVFSRTSKPQETRT